MSNAQPTMMVYVVDDETPIREGIDSLLRSVGYGVSCFASVDDFLAFDRPPLPSCLLLDIRLPGRSGLELQKQLAEHEDSIPIIFLTGHGDVQLSVRAMKSGALDFLLKPFHEQTLLDTVQAGIERDHEHKLEVAKSADFRGLMQTLSRRESEVLLLVGEGLSNKEIASRLSLKEITIKVHRASGMRKLRCKSIVDFVTKLNQHSRKHLNADVR